MTSEIIEKKKMAVIDNGGTAMVSIPKEWRALAGISNDGVLKDDCWVALARGKHGFFIAVWNEGQVK